MNRTFSNLGTFRGFNYVPPEPAVSLPQAILAGLVVACFALGVLAFAVAATC